ncbi:papain-like cysteine protease family protein [Andreprevotia chitinilytica]|uniref:papain-like cysteine protease family protein n=1 Tax=Andreprevotia chitinilytica TaxID=396808 RepID=UPI000B0F5636|nr:papain-like cysteine protease family protein [Andreprevotia chitinilytica]
MALIRANRETVDDRFSIVGFTVRTGPNPLFEVAVASDPELFKPENRAKRGRNNFYSSRAAGAMRARRGEAVYLIPPDVLTHFVGNKRLYFGLATYAEGNRAEPTSVQAPTTGSPFINIAGLTGRGLRRLTSSPTDVSSSYGAARGEDSSLAWGGDRGGAQGGNVPTTASPDTRRAAADGRAAQSPANGAVNGSSAVNGHTASSAASRTTPSAPDAHYDDGFDHRLWQQAPQQAPQQSPTQQAPAPAPTASAPAAPTASSSAPGPAHAQSLAYNGKPTARPLDLIVPSNQPTLWDQLGFLRDSLSWFFGVTDTTVYPQHAICQIRRPTAGGGDEHVGTAFYVGRNRLLTAAHVVEGETNLIVVPGRNDTAEPFGRYTVAASSFRIPASRNTANHDFDIAVLDNTPQAAPNGRWFDLMEELLTSQPSPIIVCGYSSQSRRVPQINNLINENKQHLHSGRIQTVQDNTFSYDIQTLAGASGAPVYYITDNGGQPQIHLVGVHVSGLSDTENQGTRLTEAKIAWIEGRTTTLGLATARAQSIPLDPGAGGQSIGVAALQAGDIIVSTTDHATSYLIRGGSISAVSHAMLYIGDGKVVEAVGQGVIEHPLADAISDAILAVAFRYPNLDDMHRQAVVSYARSQVGLPYNYAGAAYAGYRIWNPITRIGEWIGQRLSVAPENAGSFYCSQLVLEAYARAGVALTTEAPDVSTPGDIVQLTHSVLSYVGHLVASDSSFALALATTDPIQPSPYRRRIRHPARALDDSSFRVYWGDVPFQQQSSTGSCWAAAAAMIVGWRDSTCISDQDIAAKVPVVDAYLNGLWPQDRHVLADVWNLVAEPPQSYTLDGFRQLLANSGPLWVATRTRSGGGHILLVIGMESDGAADGSDTNVLIYDPWPGSAGRQRMRWLDFITRYEGRATSTGGVMQPQILHADGTQGRQQATAAPFGLVSALGTPFSVFWSDVPYTAQTSGMSCWAASASMVVGWRDRISISDQDIAAKVPAIDAYRNGLWPRDRQPLADVWNLIPEPPQSYTLDGFRQLLASSGPLWVDSQFPQGGHVVVVVGIESGGADDGSDTTVYIHNPDPGSGQRVKMSWQQFVQYYEGRVSTEGSTLSAQLLHANGLGGRTPATVAPFALTLSANQANTLDKTRHQRTRPARPQQTPQSPQHGGARVNGLTAAGLTVSGTDAETTISPSHVPGTTMSAVTGSVGNLSWRLEQLQGFKSPAGQPSVTSAAPDHAEVPLDDWPRLSDGPVPIKLAVRWQHNGSALGNVTVVRTDQADSLPYQLQVEAAIDDDTLTYPPQAPRYAALNVTITYRFSNLPDGAATAVTQLKLYGNGTFERHGSWLK